MRTFRGAEDSMKMRQRNVGESASENLIKATSAAGNADSLMPVQRPQRDSSPRKNLSMKSEKSKLKVEDKKKSTGKKESREQVKLWS